MTLLDYLKSNWEGVPIYFNTIKFDDYFISGKIVDAETQEPILYANISVIKVKKNMYGTISDMEGNFKITLYKTDEKFKKTKISFAYKGYKTKMVRKKLLVENSINNKIIVYMNKGKGAEKGKQPKVGKKKITTRDKKPAVK